MTDITLRAARGDDTEAIVKVMQAAFGQEFINRSIFAAHGISAYLERQIRIQHTVGDSRFFVAEFGGAIAAFVEFRMLPGMEFLNQIAVHPHWQSAGLGQRLLLDGLRAGSRFDRFGLDVRAADERVASWYRRLGLSTESTTEWWAMDRPCAAGVRFLVRGMPQAMLLHETFGFCQFSVVTERAEYSVGMLGELWFRLTDSQALTDDDLLAALQAIDPKRRLLIVVSRAQVPSGGFIGGSLLDTTNRMVGETQGVIARLGRRAT